MSRKIKQKIFTIFVEGDSEMIYFKALNQQQWVRDSKYKLNLVRCKNHDELLKIALRGKYDRKNLTAFDKDHMTSEKFNKLLQMDYIVGFSNPKIELWFLAHYEKLQADYSDIDKSLKRYISDYYKTHPQIADLAKNYAQAIQNVGKKAIPNFDVMCTSVGSVIQEIA